MDARSKLAAVGNRVVGAGYEQGKHASTKIRFLGIDNIHTMRASWLPHSLSPP